MKIIYICNSIIPSRTANSIHVMKMCQAFAKNGHEIILIAPNNQKYYEANVIDIYKFYGVDPCFKVLRQPWLRIKGKGYLYGWLAAKLAKTYHPDLVYSRYIIAGYFATYLGMPVSLELHHPISSNLNEWILRQLISSDHLKQIILITHALKDYFQNRYPNIKCRLQVAPDGSDTIPNKIKPIELPNQQAKFQVGYVGHLYRGKGMEVIGRLANLCPWADFNIVGGMEKDIQFWQKQCSELKNIRFWGYVPHHQIVCYILAFDVVLLPNQELVEVAGKNKVNISQWTSPLKAFEYMAAGKAIICSDLSVLREVFEHNVNALLCPANNVKSWQSALEKLRDDSSLRASLGQKAKQIFLKKFTWQARAKSVIEYL